MDVLPEWVEAVPWVSRKTASNLCTAAVRLRRDSEGLLEVPPLVYSQVALAACTVDSDGRAEDGRAAAEVKFF